MIEMPIKKEIAKDELALMQVQRFDGEVWYIDTLEDAEKAAEELMECSILGFDTETKPTFKKGQLHKVCLLQLASANKAYLLRLHKTGIPASWVQIINTPYITKVGIAPHDDHKALRQWSPDLRPNGFVDLNKVASAMGYVSVGARKLSALLLGFTISKGQQLSNWEAEPLSKAQISYAATDAWVCWHIYHELGKMK